MSDGQQATSTAGDRPVWERRFRAPVIGFPSWARNAPDRLAVATNESGSWQVYAWDLATGSRRRVTDIAIGVDHSFVTPDGERIAWFDDASGDEIGRWIAEPFGGGAAGPLVPGVPAAWSQGIVASDDGMIALGTGAPDGFTVYVSERGQEARRIHHHAETVLVAALSRNGALLALEHAEHGDSIHFALRVVDPRSGETVGELWDGEGVGLHAAGFSPVPGDARLAIEHERAGLSRPGVWNLETGVRSDIELDLPGDVFVRGWWPDGSALLVAQEHEGRDRVYRLELPGGGSMPSTIRRARSSRHACGRTAACGTGTRAAPRRRRSAPTPAGRRSSPPRASAPPPGGPSSPGPSRTRVAIACTGSSRRRPATARSRS